MNNSGLIAGVYLRNRTLYCHILESQMVSNTFRQASLTPHIEGCRITSQSTNSSEKVYSRGEVELRQVLEEVEGY